jgi:hypothetical protein
MTDTERVEEIMRIIVDLNPTTPPDDWYPKWDDVTDHLARLPQPLAARYLAKVAKKFSVPKRDLADDVKKKRQQLAAALAPPPEYKPDSHPAIGCTSGGEFWIATASPHPLAPSKFTWLGVTASGEERVGPLEPTIFDGVAKMFEGRWSDESRRRFSENTELPGLVDVYEGVRCLVERYVEFPQEHRKGFTASVSLWIMGTYAHPLFGVYPYLTIEGSKGSGKSRLLDVLAALCFNGFLSPSVTPAVLCRIVAGARATVCFDEVEHLHHNTEDTATIRALINAGYKRGGQVPRVSREGGVDLFDAFAPKAFAGISGLNDVTADRAIRIVMTRATDSRKCKLAIDPKGSEMADVRDSLYEFALASSEHVRQAYAAVNLPKELTNRSIELWRPLFAIASLIDEVTGGDLQSLLTPMAIEDSKDRNELDPISTAVGDALWFRATAESEDANKIRPGAVADDAQNVTRRQISPEWVGRFLRRLGVKKAGRDADGAYYFIEPSRLHSELERIGWRVPDSQLSCQSLPSLPTPAGVDGSQLGNEGSDGCDGSTGEQDEGEHEGSPLGARVLDAQLALPDTGESNSSGRKTNGFGAANEPSDTPF